MNQDIKRVLKETNYQKIVTKHEWMIAALEILETKKESFKEDTPMTLYENLFIDPSQLTPYQQS